MGFGHFLHNLKTDAEGIVDPRNYLKAGKQLVTHPLGFGEDVGKSYLNIFEHPIRNIENNPLSTILALTPAAGGLGALAKLGKVGEVGRLGALRTALVEDTAGAKGLSFNHIDHGDIRHVLAKRGETHMGHITIHRGQDGTYGSWMVQQIRVPEKFRRQGIATQLFAKAKQDVGGDLYHQTDPDLLSPEGAAFAKSFEQPAPASAADVRAQMREPLHGTGPGKAHGQQLGPRFTPEELAAYLEEQRNLK